MDHIPPKNEIPPQKYTIINRNEYWKVMMFSDGPIFIKLDKSFKNQLKKVVKDTCRFQLNPMYELTICPQCEHRQLDIKWCQNCESRNFVFNFGNWTSGDQKLDQFIQRSQFQAQGPLNYLEWIPWTEFSKVDFIAKGGFGHVESAIWNLGPRQIYDSVSREWKRTGQHKIALKYVNGSHQYLQEFLNEVRSHYKYISENNHILHCFGITQNPKSKDYAMVLEYAHHCSLRNYLDMNIKTISWDDRFVILQGIAAGLKYIHKENRVHQDFHSGNILIHQKGGNLYPMIGDLGLCRPLNKNNENFGIIPYIAPEVFRGLGYTQAADIYSLGIIMWEMLTGEKPYKDHPHDIHLAFKIINDGFRPTIPEGTPGGYRILMQNCWHKNLANRPEAREVKHAAINLKDSPEFKHLIRKRGPIRENLIFNATSIHSEACYISRHLQFDELRGESCQHPKWPGKGWDLLKKKLITKHDQEIEETQYRYISQEYDLLLDIDFLHKPLLVESRKIGNGNKLGKRKRKPLKSIPDTYLKSDLHCVNSKKSG
ncbi:kinase-like domain-containing protein [Glomus cerebriforme]|uniref:Kinase-like domain-containing protein n=1 Tax=Glomus cerebriforme TaxID=658196 RepID=A0A397S8Y3_9GLOM|nr:kinase-like domain-containing protein [Glomus cerebriforme]